MREGLPGLELRDGDARPEIPDTEITGAGLQRLRWRRYEIESYLVHPDALARFVEATVGAETATPYVDDMRAYMRREFPSAVIDDPLGNHPFLNGTKARTEILPPILNAAEIHDLPYTRYHEIAQADAPRGDPPRNHREARCHLPRLRGRAVNAHEVPEPILNSPFEEPREHWWITEHDPPERRARPASRHVLLPAAGTRVVRRIGRAAELPSG